MLKGVFLAWLLCGKRGVVDGVAVLWAASVSMSNEEKRGKKE